MRCGRLAEVFASIVLGLTVLSGCSSVEKEQIFEPDGGLLDLKAFLESAKASGQATTKEAASPMLAAVHLGADYYIRSGQIEYIWGTKLTDGPEAAHKVIAFQTSAATDGGWVLFQDGSLKRLSAAEFAQAPKAEP
jgi:hypothetical protein